MGLKVLVLAGRKTGLESIRRLLDSGRHEIVGVVSEDYEHLVNDGLACEDYAQLLSPSGIPFWKTDKIHKNDLVETLKELSPDVGLSIGWRRLVKEPVVSIPTMGFVNFHTSDLPRYRGFASTSWAILKGDDQIAITAHKMIPGFADEGDILMKKVVPIGERTDIGALFDDVVDAIPSMVLEVLDKLKSEEIEYIPQDEADCVLSYPRHPSDGWIDWTRSAEEIDRLVRSVAKPYPGAFTCWNMKKVIVWKGRVLKDHKPFVGVPGHVIGSDDNRSIKVLTGDGIYVIEGIQMEGSEECIPPASLIKGAQQRLGLTQGELFETLKRLMDGKE